MLLNNYMMDGANKQARAVLCMLQGFEIESSWNKEYHKYDAEVEVGRWENGREQGYVVSLTKSIKKQGDRFPIRTTVNIAWFEHRNSDSICAIVWEGLPNMNTPRVGDVPTEAYPDKWAVAHSVSYGEIVEMAEWIENNLTKWYEGE